MGERKELPRINQPEPTMKDLFRPTTEPSRRIYDAFQDEATKRAGRTSPEWHEAEKQRVWLEARDYAQQNQIPVPTMEQIEAAERSANGHADYGSKWAWGVARLLAKPHVTAS